MPMKRKSQKMSKKEEDKKAKAFFIIDLFF